MARLFTYLVIDAPEQPQQLILWDTLEITVGRAPDRDVVVAHAEVSRQHAVFRLEGQSYTIADLHTSNGTFVNGARVSSHALRPGDVVELGPARISFRQATESPKGKHVRFASQLKAFSPLGDAGADGSRTVLGMSPGGPAAFDGADYGDRLPTGEAQFEWTAGEPGDGAAPAAAVVDLDPVLDASLEEVELASFEDEELASLEDDKPQPPVAARAARPEPPVTTRTGAATSRPAPAAPTPTASAPRAPTRPAVAAAPVQAPRVAPPTTAPVAARTAPAPVAAEDPRTRAVLTLELEGPRGALKAVVGALLDRELDLGPLRLRLRRPS